MNRHDFNTNKRSRVDPFSIGDRVMFLDKSHEWMHGVIREMLDKHIGVHFDHYPDEKIHYMFAKELLHE